MSTMHIQDAHHRGRAALFLQEESHLLADRMPRLMLAARQVALQAQAGIHGRRRAGAGENFWQYRPFYAGEAASSIDWRRSAKDDHLYIREREWEAAHTVWIGVDLSRSMGFKSSESRFSKQDKAVILTLALAAVLVQGGERVGLIGISPPKAQRHIIAALGAALAAQKDYIPFAPQAEGISAAADIVLISDFLTTPEDHIAMLGRFSATSGQKICLTLADPAEETFPFSGRTEFIDPENGRSLTLGRAQTRKQHYQNIYTAHHQALAQLTVNKGWRALRHRTDHATTEVLLALYAQLANH